MEEMKDVGDVGEFFENSELVISEEDKLNEINAKKADTDGDTVAVKSSKKRLDIYKMNDISRSIARKYKGISAEEVRIITNLVIEECWEIIFKLNGEVHLPQFLKVSLQENWKVKNGFGMEVESNTERWYKLKVREMASFKLARKEKAKTDFGYFEQEGDDDGEE